MIMFVVKAALMSIFSFYRVSLPQDIVHGNMMYEKYVGGKPVLKAVVRNNSRSYHAVKQFLNSERSGWKYDLVSYAPNILFVTDTMNMDCYGNKVVINYSINGVWTQVSKTTLHECPSIK